MRGIGEYWDDFEENSKSDDGTLPLLVMEVDSAVPSNFLPGKGYYDIMLISGYMYYLVKKKDGGWISSDEQRNFMKALVTTDYVDLDTFGLLVYGKRNDGQTVSVANRLDDD